MWVTTRVTNHLAIPPSDLRAGMVRLWVPKGSIATAHMKSVYSGHQLLVGECRQPGYGFLKKASPRLSIPSRGPCIAGSNWWLQQRGQFRKLQTTHPSQGEMRTGDAGCFRKVATLWILETPSVGIPSPRKPMVPLQMGFHSKDLEFPHA